MIMNLCSKNFELFPNKVGEQLEILKKCLLPPFIVFPIYANIAVAPFMFMLAVCGIFFNSTLNKT
jgi:hypothetical protein